MMGERGIGLNRGLLVHFAFRALSSDATVIGCQKGGIKVCYGDAHVSKNKIC